jgi:undecaprenyl-diphosphatase
MALAIGASRVLLNVHFLSDVAAGFAIGLAWLCCCAIVRDVAGGERRRRRDIP